MTNQPGTVVYQTGVLPYRFVGSTMQLGLITTTSGRRWIVPKGHIERDLSPRDSAAKEAFEEAGFLGPVHELCLGRFSVEKKQRRHVVDVYPMHVRLILPHWPEAHKRQRQWLAVHDATRLLDDGNLVACVHRLNEFVIVHMERLWQTLHNAA